MNENKAMMEMFNTIIKSKKYKKEPLENLYQEIINEENGIEVSEDGYQGKFSYVLMKDVNKLIGIYLKQNNIKGTVKKSICKTLTVEVKNNIKNDELKKLLDFAKTFNWVCLDKEIGYFGRRFCFDVINSNHELLARNELI